MTTNTAVPTWMNVNAVPADIRAEIAEQIDHLRDLMPELVGTFGNLRRLASRYEAARVVPEDVREHLDAATGFKELDGLVELIMVMSSLDDAGWPTDDIDVLAARVNVEVPWALIGT